MILIKQPKNQKRVLKENNTVKVDEECLNYFLKRYKNVFSQEIYEYMNSLIHMESLILKDINMIEIRKSLMDIDIYRNIAGYNIYNHLLSSLESLNNSSITLYKDIISIRAYTNIKDRVYRFLTYYYYPYFEKKKGKNSLIGQINISLYNENNLTNESDTAKINQSIYYEFLDKLGIKEKDFKNSFGIDDRIFGIETRLVKQYPETNINVLVKKR